MFKISAKSPLDLHRRIVSDLNRKEKKELGKLYKPCLDGRWQHRRPIRLLWAWRHGSWRTWFKSHGVVTGALPVLGQSSCGCMLGYVETLAKIYHLGPIKIVLGPALGTRD